MEFLGCLSSASSDLGNLKVNPQLGSLASVMTGSMGSTWWLCKPPRQPKNNHVLIMQAVEEHQAWAVQKRAKAVRQAELRQAVGLDPGRRTTITTWTDSDALSLNRSLTTTLRPETFVELQL